LKNPRGRAREIISHIIEDNTRRYFNPQASETVCSDS
jgi:hypothetical protein